MQKEGGGKSLGADRSKQACGSSSRFAKVKAYIAGELGKTISRLGGQGGEIAVQLTVKKGYLIKKSLLCGNHQLQKRGGVPPKTWRDAPDKLGQRANEDKGP